MGEILTRPTSTSLVIMTMLEQCSCHTMRQKSYTISCLGPGDTGKAPTDGQGPQAEHSPGSGPLPPCPLSCL